jgi:hypothetical protein
MTFRMRVFAVVLLASPALAQVLHEPVAVGTLQCKDGFCKQDGVGPTRAVVDDGKVKYAPEGDAQPKPGEQVFAPKPDHPVEVGQNGGGGGGGDPPPDRRDIIHTDRDTGPEGPGLHTYHSVFDPEPFPYKRMTALDSVRILNKGPDDDDEVLEVLDTTLAPVAIIGAQRARDRDLFWGSIVVDFESNRWVPIPSVAPESRVLEARTEPPIQVEFAKDGADNFFVRSVSGGRHRLIWLTDAPRHYFAGELPRVLLSDEPRSLRRPIPDKLKRRVDRVLQHIGVRVRPSMPLAEILDPLVNYFRAFEVGTLPPPSGSSYCDLALNQRGCCRHRSYAFAITAMGVGIPVRYVENELHVYVEVFVPKLGWRRINLGGALLNEQIVGGENKTLYDPKDVDPFPQPPAFAKGGSPPPVGMEAMKPGAAAKGVNESGDGNVPAQAEGPQSRPGPARIDLGALEKASAHEEAVRPRKRATTQITVELATRATFRGDSVEVAGRVAAQGASAGGLPVEVYLDAAGGAVRVGSATTADDGRWHTAVDVPRDLPLGQHRVVARTPGDERRAPSSSR